MLDVNQEGPKEIVKDSPMKTSSQSSGELRTDSEIDGQLDDEKESAEPFRKASVIEVTEVQNNITLSPINQESIFRNSQVDQIAQLKPKSGGYRQLKKSKTLIFSTKQPSSGETP